MRAGPKTAADRWSRTCASHQKARGTTSSWRTHQGDGRTRRARVASLADASSGLVQGAGGRSLVAAASLRTDAASLRTDAASLRDRCGVSPSKGGVSVDRCGVSPEQMRRLSRQTPGLAPQAWHAPAPAQGPPRARRPAPSPLAATPPLLPARSTWSGRSTRPCPSRCSACCGACWRSPCEWERCASRLRARGASKQDERLPLEILMIRSPGLA